MKLAAYVLSLITTIVWGFALIPLCWCIPMTVRIYNAYKNGEKVSIGFGVCELLFVNVISGILLLIDSSSD